MKIKRLLQSVVIISATLLVMFIIRGLQPRSQSTPIVNVEADGLAMVYTHYDEENRKAMEIRCLESKRENDDRIVMKGIESTIFSDGELSKDIKISGDSGYVENNFHNFMIEENAAIESDTVLINSHRFNLRDRDILESKGEVKYRIKDLSGTALERMRFNITANIVSFFNTSGEYRKEDKYFTYRTDMLRLKDHDRTVRLQGKAEMIGKNNHLRADLVVILFSEKFENILDTKGSGNCYFIEQIPAADGTQEVKEITSGSIRDLYNQTGTLTETRIREKAWIRLENRLNRTQITSNLVKLFFRPESGSVEEIQVFEPAYLTNSGKKDFEVSASTIDLLLDESGEPIRCRAETNDLLLDESGEPIRYRAENKCLFIINEYQGSAEKLIYNIAEDLFLLTGPDSRIRRNSNTFIARQFSVDMERKILKSSIGVKSTLLLEGDNALFSEAPIQINAEKLEINEEKQQFVYDTKVKLSQEDTILTTSHLEIDENNRIVARGKATLSFKSRENMLDLKGESLEFLPASKQIIIKQNASIFHKENRLKANQLVITFNSNDEIDFILGSGKVTFSKENLTGSSEEVKWNFSREVMTFSGSPEIKLKDGGTEKGEVLELNLKDNKIVIISGSERRSATLMDRSRP